MHVPTVRFVAAHGLRRHEGAVEHRSRNSAIEDQAVSAGTRQEQALHVRRGVSQLEGSMVRLPEQPGFRL